MNLTIEQAQTENGIDVTTIKVNLKYPTNKFELYAWEFCPYSLKTKLAFQYKHLYYKDLDYGINYIFPYNNSILKKLEFKTGHASVPQVKIQYKQGIEETWVGDSTAICKFLDSVYPCNSLFHTELTNLNFEVALLEDWLDEAFKKPFLTLLFLNKENLEKATNIWTLEEESIFNRVRLSLFKNERVAYYSKFFGNVQQALASCYKRLDEELLPIIVDRLENHQLTGHSFLTGQHLTVADLALYAYLKLILKLEESNLVTRRSTLQKFIESIESLGLNKAQGNSKKGYTRQKMSLREGASKSVQEVTI
jgi:glutathione S-transferase